MGTIPKVALSSYSSSGKFKNFPQQYHIIEVVFDFFFEPRSMIICLFEFIYVLSIGSSF